LEVDWLIYEIVAGDKRKEIEKKGGTGWRWIEEDDVELIKWMIAEENIED
jgi:hypothetical protein